MSSALEVGKGPKIDDSFGRLPGEGRDTLSHQIESFTRKQCLANPDRLAPQQHRPRPSPGRRSITWIVRIHSQALWRPRGGRLEEPTALIRVSFPSVIDLRHDLIQRRSWVPSVPAFATKTTKRMR